MKADMTLVTGLPSRSHKSRLILGVDGGGSKTAALVASVDENGQLTVIGHGRGGPSNLSLAGKEQSLASLDQAIDQALAEADAPGQTFDHAVLALAGSTSPEVQRDVTDWAENRSLALKVEIVPDADPVLAQGTDHGTGIVLIVGTGTVAMGLDENGDSVTKGGWGHWFGDKGSGFYLGYKALAAVAEASDEIGPETLLSGLVLGKLGTTDPRSILKEVLDGGDTRREVAALAPLVLDAASQQDGVALSIVDHAVSEAVKLVAAVVKTMAFKEPYSLALAGSVVCRNQLFQDALLKSLNRLQPPPSSVRVVEDPVEGCLKIARKHLLAADVQVAGKN